MADKGITVWVYDDEGTSALSVNSALATFKTKLLVNNLTAIRTISSKDIIAGRLSDNSAIGLLIMPGGADLPYCHKLNGLGNHMIREFVNSGNIYIGICAGGYYGARDIEFLGEGYEITGARELAFFSGTAIGSMSAFTNGQLYDQTVASKAMVTLDYADGQQDDVYYHGGAHFTGEDNTSYDILARYSDGTNAVIAGEWGQGKYLLSGVHFELWADHYHEYVVAQAKAIDLEKERLLLAAINHKRYGVLIYDYIKKMMSELSKTLYSQS